MTGSFLKRVGSLVVVYFEHSVRHWKNDVRLDLERGNRRCAAGMSGGDDRVGRKVSG